MHLVWVAPNPQHPSSGPEVLNQGFWCVKNGSLEGSLKHIQMEGKMNRWKVTFFSSPNKPLLLQQAIRRLTHIAKAFKLQYKGSFLKVEGKINWEQRKLPYGSNPTTGLAKAKLPVETGGHSPGACQAIEFHVTPFTGQHLLG